MSFATGWIPNPELLAEYRASLPDRGHIPMAAPAPDGEPLKGYWKRQVARGVTGVFLQDAELELFGTHHPAQSQQRGTCVSQSMKRACEDSLWAAIARRGQIAKPVRFCFETIYAGSRVNIGRGELGAEDGSYGVWAVKYLRKYGLLPRGVYQGKNGPIDLSKDQESWSIAWGAPGAGVPQALLEASAPFTVDACYFPEVAEDIADSLAAWYAGQRCAALIFGAPDHNGLCQPEGDGGHAEELCGVYLDENGETCLVEQQSWADVPGKVTLRYAGGLKPLRQGSYGIKLKTLWQYASGGNGNEVWMVGNINAPRPEASA